MKCYLCEEKIEYLPNGSTSGADYYTVSNTAVVPYSVHLHTDCWKAMAEEDIHNLLNNSYNMNLCVFCLKEQREKGNFLCNECAKNAPSCPTCNQPIVVSTVSPTYILTSTTPMILRYSRKTKRLFFGCRNFPRCTGVVSL